MRKIVLSVILGLTMAAFAGAEPTGEFPTGIPDTFRIRLGGFFADLETDVSARPIDDPDDNFINFENDLGFEDGETAFRADMSWRFAKRFSLDAGFVSFSRSAGREISREIEFEDEVFEVGARVDAEFNSLNFYGGVRWDFVKNDAFEVGALLGVDYFNFETSLTGEVNVGGTTVTRTRGHDVNAPVPVIGLQATGVIVPGKVTLGGYIRLLTIEIDQAEGSLTDASGRLDWFIWKNGGIGVSYDWNDLDLERLETGGFEYSFQYKYQGPRIFAILTF